MTWVLFAFLTAFFESAKDVFGKKGLARSDEYVVAWAWRFFAIPFLLPPLLLTGIPPLDRQFFLALAVSGSLNLITSVLYLRALRLSDLSVTVPMVTFTPLFLLLTSPLLLGESPNALGMTGVLLIVLGSYLLNIRQRSQGYLAPFKALLREPGPRLMLLVALTWSITANVDKIGLQHSSPMFYGFALNAFLAIGLFPLALRRMRGNRLALQANFGNLLAIGACGGLTIACQMYALSLAIVPYVIAIKRTSSIMSVLWGALVFREAGLRERLTGTVVMVAGVALIVLG